MADAPPPRADPGVDNANPSIRTPIPLYRSPISFRTKGRNAVASLAQPNASRMPKELLDAVLQAIGADASGPPEAVVYRDQHSNDFAEVQLRDGRAVIMKRARYDWAKPRFRTSRIASRLIRQGTRLAVPAPLSIPDDLDEMPVEAYWRINLPTLHEVWPTLDEPAQVSAMRSWGELISQLHQVRLAGAGPLADETTSTRSVADFLQIELGVRLLPAVAAEWSEARWIVEQLLAVCEEVAARVGERNCLVHNDMHMGNVLCRVGASEVHCAGLIDLETAISGPPESDIAGMEVHHGALFSQPIQGNWREQVRDAYGRKLDEWVVNFYRAFHLVNMGFYSALIGHEWHASQVARAAGEEVERLLDPVPLAKTA
jgi:aminoglycoside phosphotransferase (APT) family kinase protein